MLKIKSNFKPWLMWVPVLLFFAYQFVMRLAPGVVKQELINKFQIDATSFGLLASMYYYGYSGMQIPIAVLLDKFGARIIVSICVFFCSIATLAFVFTDNWITILFTRFIIGACSAAAFLGVSKVISEWFPSDSYGKIVGISFSFGLLGALYGGKPMVMLLEQYNWEILFKFVGIIGFVIFALIFLIVRSPNDYKKNNEENNNILGKLFLLIKNPILIFVAISNLLMVGALEGFADVWGISYLEQVYKLEKADASFATSMVFTGMLFGGPLLAYIAEKFNDYFGVTALSGIIMAVLFILILFGQDWLCYKLLCLIIFIIGILCCYQVLIFAIGTKLVSPAIISIAIAFLNCINMLGGSFFHTSIGFLMDGFWDGKLENGIRIYSDLTYSMALLIIPIASFIGAIILLVIRTKRKKLFS